MYLRQGGQCNCETYINCTRLSRHRKHVQALRHTHVIISVLLVYYLACRLCSHKLLIKMYLTLENANSTHRSTSADFELQMKCRHFGGKWGHSEHSTFQLRPASPGLAQVVQHFITWTHESTEKSVVSGSFSEWPIRSRHPGTATPSRSWQPVRDHMHDECGG